MFARACLLAAAFLTASAVGGQPPDAKKDAPKPGEEKPPYTAFPDLKPPTLERKEVKTPDGRVEIVYDRKGVVPLPPIPELGANAPALRKVRYEQLHAGLSYLERVRRTAEIAGSPDPNTFQQDLIFATEVYRLAAELEEKPAKRVPWYEARVRTFKELEGYIDLRVKAGAIAPQNADLARFRRLQAEAELLMLKAEVQKAD